MKPRAILRESEENFLDKLVREAQDAYVEGDYKHCKQLLDEYNEYRMSGVDPGYPKADQWIEELKHGLDNHLYDDQNADSQAVDTEEDNRISVNALNGQKWYEMSEEERNKFSGFVTPNDIYQEGSITFIYNGRKLYTDEYPTAHQDMMMYSNSRKEIFAGTKLGPRPGYVDWHSLSQSVVLLGRVSHNKEQMSIWNTDPALVLRLMSGAVADLIKLGLIYEFTVVHAPVYDEPIYAEDVATAQTHAPSAEDLERLEAMCQIHLSPPEQKRALMKKAGVGASRQGPHPMAAAMMKTGRLAPGQKWWGWKSSSGNCNLFSLGV